MPIIFAQIETLLELILDLHRPKLCVLPIKFRIYAIPSERPVFDENRVQIDANGWRDFEENTLYSVLDTRTDTMPKGGDWASVVRLFYLPG